MFKLFKIKIVFETSDYSLVLDERRKKFKSYALIFCGKCKKKISKFRLHCEYCYCKETDEEEKNRILYGKCKGCFQACTDDNWCSSCGLQNNDNIKKQIVFKTMDYDLNSDGREVKYKDYGLILCGECKLQLD